MTRPQLWPTVCAAVFATIAAGLAPTPAASADPLTAAQASAATAGERGETCGSSDDSYGKDRWAWARTEVCAQVKRDDNGNRYIEALYGGKFQYYWGAAWYHEQAKWEAQFEGRITAYRGDTYVAATEFSERVIDDWGKIYGKLAIHDVKPGQTYRFVGSKGKKKGGYWAKNGVRWRTEIYDIPRTRVTITVT
ncbi:hypothetical protein SMC26_08005 [Actinomadura fulvescens]|uniref:Uncharacterized protein n=1 Tax=Actinomadura fulvescens TaxID=46160 RepID=A0ABP6DBK2_9ACTN